MALLARLALKKIVTSSTITTSLLHNSSPNNLLTFNRALILLPKQHQPNWNTTTTSNIIIPKEFTTDASPSSSYDKSDGGNQVTVSTSNKKSKWLQRNKLGRKGGLWRKNNRNSQLFPFNLNHLFSSRVGDALLQATENLNRLIENFAPTHLLGRMKENESRYKLKFEVPGLSKEDIKITIEDGYLTIKGEHKEEEEEGSEDEDEHWSSSRYGYYETSLMLPDDSKIEEIKAEMKDGILSLTIPRTGNKGKDVKEIKIS